MNDPQPFPTPAPNPKSGLSITSLVLGILGFGCFGILTGLPAIITGHIARGRARRDPQLHGGAGLALIGLILGYVSIITTIVMVAVVAALVLPALAKAKQHAVTSGCVNNMKQIGLAARIWSNDHNEVFPPDIVTMSNELVSLRILVCPDDKSKSPAADWSLFDPSKNLSYEYLTPNAKETDVMGQTTFRCPIHGNIGRGDGSVQQGKAQKGH
jgi:competence protein ComGC